MNIISKMCTTGHSRGKLIDVKCFLKLFVSVVFIKVLLLQ